VGHEVRKQSDGNGTSPGYVVHDQLLKLQEIGQFPDESSKIKFAQTNTEGDQRW
jgi:hypothetical protein